MTMENDSQEMLAMSRTVRMSREYFKFAKAHGDSFGKHDANKRK